MNLIKTMLPDVYILEPRIFTDERGFFYESFNQHIFNECLGQTITFVQDNHSYSKRHVLRGLHYQIQQPQAKLVRVIKGSVFDVVVDIRKGSPTFSQWISVELSAENHRQLWVPVGFAHGFLVLSETAEFLYKVTDYWVASYGRCIRWDDPTLQITWPTHVTPLLSSKDTSGAFLNQAELFD